jgi:hypothetical protein
MSTNKIYYLKDLKQSTKNLLEKNEENVSQHSFNNVYQINVLIKDKKFKIFCGDGRQRLRWLADCSIFKFENNYGGSCGLAYGIKLENGNLCDLGEVINTVMKPQENVWVLLKEEYEVYQEEVKRRLNGSIISGKNISNNMISNNVSQSMSILQGNASQKSLFKKNF